MPANGFASHTSGSLMSELSPAQAESYTTPSRTGYGLRGCRVEQLGKAGRVEVRSIPRQQNHHHPHPHLLHVQFRGLHFSQDQQAELISTSFTSPQVITLKVKSPATAPSQRGLLTQAKVTLFTFAIVCAPLATKATISVTLALTPSNRCLTNMAKRNRKLQSKLSLIWRLFTTAKA